MHLYQLIISPSFHSAVTSPSGTYRHLREFDNGDMYSRKKSMCRLWTCLCTHQHAVLTIIICNAMQHRLKLG